MVRHGRPLTVSIGMTSFGEDPKAGGPDLMVLADVAMYEAKARGGDDCVVYDPNVAVSGRPWRTMTPLSSRTVRSK